MTSAMEVIKAMMEQDDRIRESVQRDTAIIKELEMQSELLRCIIEQNDWEECERRRRLGIMEGE